MKTAKRKQALIAGSSLIVMAVAAMFAYGYVFPRVEVEGDPVATWMHIRDNHHLFLAGLGGWLVIFITDLLVTVSLFYFFRETRKKLSLATAAIRLVYTLILGIALTALFALIPVLKEPDMDSMQAGSRVLDGFDSFRKLWSLGLIIFGFHLLGLGVLTILHDRIHNFFGILLLVAGVGYLVVHISEAMHSIPAETVALLESVLMLPMALGEILFAIWLIARGGKEKKQ